MTHPPYYCRQRVTCADGFSISIQAHEGSYCTPRKGNAKAYEEVELGFPSEPDDLITPFAECFMGTGLTETVYPYTNAAIVHKLIAKHGGMISGELPPLTGEPIPVIPVTIAVEFPIILKTRTPFTYNEIIINQ